MNNSEEKAPPDKSEREELEDRIKSAEALWDGNFHDNRSCYEFMADVVESEVIRALKDAAKLVCEFCEAGYPTYDEGGPVHHELGIGPEAKCYAAAIHAQIAALESTKAEQ